MSLLVERWPSHRVDARAHREEPTSLDSVLDGSSAETQLQQLPAGHDAVLASSKQPCLRAPRIRFSTHSGVSRIGSEELSP